jgi:hypothetical protein
MKQIFKNKKFKIAGLAVMMPVKYIIRYMIKTSSLRLILYVTSILVASSAGLLFKQVSVVRHTCLLAMLIIAIFIYFDKNYRNKYIPSIPDWFLVGIIVLELVLFVYSLFI